MEEITVTIDGKELKVPAGITVLKACKLAGVDVPTLCYLEGVNEIGSCRMCLVEIEGVRGLNTACTYPAFDGMVVRTNTAKLREARKMNLELILSNHKRECTTCVRSHNCELQKLCKDLGVEDVRFEGVREEKEIDELSPSIVRDNNKCILCKRCVAVCKKKQGISAIGAVNRGFASEIRSPFGESLNTFECINCGQCIEACPVGALYEKDSTKKVWDFINDPETIAIVHVAPSVRVALGEEFGMPIGTSVTGKMVTALKRLGFNYVFDTNTSADLTIMEEGNELIDRISNKGKLPLITSCCPAWVKECEQEFPDLLDNVSSCKSPQEMMAALLKSYFADKLGLDKSKIKVVSVMPCTAKKFETKRSEFNSENDESITTRELARMIKEAGIIFNDLEDSHFDNPFGDGSGAGVIFGATGGVTEAAMRTAVEVLTNGAIQRTDYNELRGAKGVKEYTVEAAGITIKGAIVSGMAHAKELLQKVRNGEIDVQFIEIMACEGGCICGGGQPIVSAKDRMDIDVWQKRADAMYNEDKDLPIRKSHENPAIKQMYDEYYEKPLSHKAHEELHTTYSAKIKYPDVK
ncbi:MAG: [FeFe] hydrogenase, group A [Clostridia bacterium]|nr:[FeFe] hydrogenase, group A [Clostridia bacterium]